MTAQLATLACIVFVIHLFRQDIKSSPVESKALWVPFAWTFIAGSRFPTTWLNISAPTSASGLAADSPIDRAVFLALIVAGLVILARRDIDWSGLLLKNKILVLYVLFCLMSISWSDEPFVAFKRWFKDLGNPIMVLVILTTPRPLEALTQTLRRLSYLWLPLSVLFVKYYPDLGRAYHFDGSAMYTGVGSQKNALGTICLVTGIYILWQILHDRERFSAWTGGERMRIYILAGMMGWLLYMSESKTSLICLFVAGAVILAWRLPFVRSKPKLVELILACSLSYMALDAAFDIKTHILSLLGRDATLTNRTNIWEVVLSMDTNPALGAGYMSFWSGERLEQAWSMIGAPLRQAHNGYIEQYLNLGYVGVGFIVLLLLAALIDIRSELRIDPRMATLRLCFVLAAILYNVSEASFYGMSIIWFSLLVAVIRLPNPAPSTQSVRKGM